MEKYQMFNHLIDIFGDMIDPAGYIKRIWEDPYPWQLDALNPLHKRLMLNCARQSGKSTIVSGITLHKAKYKSNSLNLIVSPSEKQSKETMKKVEDYIALDPDLKAVALPSDSAFEKKFKSGSRIVALPGTEKSVRGYSKPDTILIDEAARVTDETYKAMRPMLTGNPDAQIILLSTPWNMMGFFHEEWTKNPIWKKIYVVPKWELDEISNKLVERPEESIFKEEYARQNISAYFSPRHTLQFLYEELMSIGPIWFEREYGCRFVEGMETMFSLDLIQSSYAEEIKVEDGVEDRYTDEIEVADSFGGLFK